MVVTKVCFIVVAFNSTALIERLFSSLASQSGGDWACYVVDNSDRDPCDAVTEQFALSRPGRVHYVRTGANLGYFPAAFSIFREREIPGNFDFVVVCNPDLEIAEDFLQEVDRVADAGWADAILAPSVVDAATGIDSNPHLLRPPSPAYRFAVAIASTASPLLRVARMVRPAGTRARRQHEAKRGGWEEFSRLYAGHGSLMILPSRFFELGGTLEYGVSLYGEEEFVADQAARLGVAIVYVPSVRAIHFAHHSTGRRSAVVQKAARRAAWSGFWRSVDPTAAGRLHRRTQLRD